MEEANRSLCHCFRNADSRRIALAFKLVLVYVTFYDIVEYI